MPYMEAACKYFKNHTHISHNKKKYQKIKDSNTEYITQICKY